MYTLRVESKLSSAHNLRGYRGKCESLHGHNWKVQIEISSERLRDDGMVCDFTEIRDSLNLVLEKMDHMYLNDLEYFKDVNPTSENIARYIYDRFCEARPDLMVSKVTVWETDTSSASYFGIT